MIYRHYKYQIAVIVTAVALILVAYKLVLFMVDSIMVDYEVYSSVREIGSDPGSIDRQWDMLFRELSERQTALDDILSREEFSQDIFQNLAPQYKCRLVKFENRDIAEKRETEYSVTFSGPIRGLLELLNQLETGFIVQVEQAVLTAYNEAGTIVRMAVILRAGKHEI